MMRAVASVPPPAPHGTMSWTGRCGYWANAEETPSNSAASNTLRMTPPRVVGRPILRRKILFLEQTHERTRPGRIAGIPPERSQALPHPVLHRRRMDGQRKNPGRGQPGHRLAARHGAAARRRRDAPRDRSGGARLAGVAGEDREGAGRAPAQMVRADDG